MPGVDGPIGHISDTARWAAVYRAHETARPDALFSDPFAGKLAGPAGERIYGSFPSRTRQAWAWVTRTILFDQLITAEIARGVDVVLNLAAGLDARPYRMALAPGLRWIEVDHPGILEYKEHILCDERPSCVLERVHLDLADVDARRTLFDRVNQIASRVLVITEGLLIYLPASDVGALADDLTRMARFERWVLDLVSPGLLKILRKEVGVALAGAGATLVFAPENGADFFRRHAWNPIEVRSMLKTASGLGRLPFFLKVISLLPERQGGQGSWPWSGVCLLERA